MDELTTNEPAALELGCIVNDIKHIIVCGHSDCKAMNLLYKLQDAEFSSLVSIIRCYFVIKDFFNLFKPSNFLSFPSSKNFKFIFSNILLFQTNRRISPLRAWLCTHALSSLEKFQQLELTDFSKPLLFQAETPLRKFVAYIDHENKFAIEDKLSQINTLQQLQNIASYGFLKKRLETNELHIHALWFDIYTGEIYYFSRAAKTFVPVNDDTIEKMLDEVLRYYS